VCVVNLGCPQGIAKRGNYGSFLLDKCYWPLLYAMGTTVLSCLGSSLSCD
jgi:tRNA-dihydrouridine synthase